MPNTSSAKKALRQSVRRRARNASLKNRYKKSVKEFRNLVADKKTGDAQTKLTGVFQILDKAAKNNIIKKNKANRLKSRAAHLIARSTKASS
jgi:small subunit ribosomal protein S20